MSTIVFQNRSCFESLLSETTSSTTIKLKVAPPPPGLCKQTPANIDANWGLLQTGDNYTECDNYTHCPWAKKSSFSTITGKPLELCTENLGSETGSDVIADADGIFSSNSSEYYKRAETGGNYLKQKVISEKKASHSFPPPLTTMTGPRSLQVRRQVDGGRLIIDSVESPFRSIYLQSERSDGRLRMSFVTAEATTTSAAAVEDEDETEEVEEIEVAENEVGLVDQLNEKVELDGEINNNNTEMEMEMEKYQWMSRCKEEGGHGNHEGLCSNWKPAFWVAIS